MKKLLKIIKELKYTDIVYVEKDRLRFVLDVNGENEIKENIRGSLRENGLIHIEKDLKKLAKKSKIEFVFDDTFLHISFFMEHSKSKLLVEKFGVDYKILS